MLRRFRRRDAAVVLTVGAVACGLTGAWPAFGQTGGDVKPIPRGWIKLRQRSPLSPVLIVRWNKRTAYVKLTPAKAPGICDVVQWSVNWPGVTVVAQPAEDHGGRLDCDTELARSVIWVVDFSAGNIRNPSIFAAGLDYPLGGP
jgi:hypothetical protein